MKTKSELLPRVHLVISHLKRWMIGTHQGAISHKHLDYYLDEFTFRFNRRRSKSRGKLFYRLAQQAVSIDPVPLDQILRPEETCENTPACSSWLRRARRRFISSSIVFFCCALIPGQFHFNIVVVDGGKEVFAVETDPGSTVTFDAKRDFAHQLLSE